MAYHSVQDMSSQDTASFCLSCRCHALQGLRPQFIVGKASASEFVFGYNVASPEVNKDVT